jgi:hypothetical protein
MSKLVALGVAAEIVVVIQHENPGLWAMRFTKVVRRGEAADPAPYHDKVIALPGTYLGSGKGLSVSTPVRRFERARVASSHSGKSRRVIARIILGDPLR